MTLSNKVQNTNSKTEQDMWAATSGMRAQSQVTEMMVPHTAQQPKHRDPRDER